MERFSEDVLRLTSLFTEAKHVNFLRRKLPISSTGREEDVIITPCIPGEKQEGMHTTP